MLLVAKLRAIGPTVVHNPEQHCVDPTMAAAEAAPAPEPEKKKTKKVKRVALGVGTKGGGITSQELMEAQEAEVSASIRPLVSQ